MALSSMWASGPLAAGIGAAVTAVYTLVTDRVRPQRGEPREAALLRTASGRVPRLDQVGRPELAGVHPAEGQPDFQLAPPYVERDVERELRQAVLESGFVLVVGESTAGKTRLAYEVARLCFPRHAFVRPLARPALAHAVRIARRRRRAVLWLDDLENYLGADGVTASALAGLLQGRPGRVVILATMQSQEFRRYDAREESRLTGSDRDAWRVQREVLHMAAQVRLERRWSADEQGRARASRDPRVRLALDSCDRFGLAEVLAAGPELLAAWENAWAPGANPRGAAIVAAAVDCRRSGLRRPATWQWLQEFHRSYLAERGGPDLQPEPFVEAMQWACKPAYATSGLLIGNYSRGYTAFDYLLSAPRLPPVPEHLWEALLSRVEAADAYDMGLLAHQASQLWRATAALERARAGGVAGADFLLAIAVGDRGRPREAVRSLAGIVRRRRAELGSRHPDTLASLHQWAFFTGEAGEVQAAADAFGELVAETTAALGPEHTDTLAARHQRAYFTGEAGDTQSAVQQLRALLEDRSRLEGPEHPQVLAGRRSLIWFSSLNGDLANAEQELRQLMEDALRTLGPDDPHLLAMRSAQADFAARAGRVREATSIFTQLIAERSRVLGQDHPHALLTRLQRAQVLMSAGDRRQAQQELTQIVDDAQRVLEPGHRHLALAQRMLNQVQRP
ncbi:tetratricopeptide repeat protein [Streptomyces anulatus]|uniref:tetratricopeptide repeat protein n=1 Tax=Streptomyces anulatus TaxID=1892 RepID=UPI001C607EE1|nr:tetratricopeptide repeat protein [Streptomyces anulatus]QYA98985.1 tetratricopeptide repeat protein [Streptomyces anulatus]